MQTDDDKDQSSSVNGKRLVKEYLELFAHVNRHYLAIAQDRYPRPRLVCSKAFSLQPEHRHLELSSFDNCHNVTTTKNKLV